MTSRWDNFARKNESFGMVKDNWWIFAIIALVISTIGILIFLGVHTTDHEAYVNSKVWKRVQIVEKFDWVHHSRESDFSYPSIPDGARDTRRWTTTRTNHHSEQVASGTYKDSKGSTHTRYKTRTWNTYTTEYHVSYDVREWTFSRDLTLTGNAHKEPEWPTTTLGSDPQERYGSRSEEYIVCFKVPYKEKEKDKSYKTHDYSSYISLKVDHKYVCKINGFGVISKIKDKETSLEY